VLVVDPLHWLDANGNLPTDVDRELTGLPAPAVDARASSLMVRVTGKPDLTLQDAVTACESIQNASHSGANILFSSSVAAENVVRVVSRKVAWASRTDARASTAAIRRILHLQRI
jgi:cell division GTPase FtsZ